MPKYSKALDGSSVSDYVAIDRKGHYQNRNDASNIITRNELENVRAKEIGWESKTERNQARQSSEYKRWIRGSLDSKAPLIMDRNQFEKMYVAAKKKDFNDSKEFRDLLVKVGLRDSGATYPVGQSPKRTNRTG